MKHKGILLAVLSAAIICLACYLYIDWLYALQHPLCEFCSKYSSFATPESARAFDIHIFKVTWYPPIVIGFISGLGCLWAIYARGKAKP